MASLMKGEWFCYRGGLFNGGGFVMLARWLSLMEGEQSCYGGGQFNRRENGHVAEVVKYI